MSVRLVRPNRWFFSPHSRHSAKLYLQSSLALKKTAPSLIRVEKKFLQNWAQRVSKKAELCADFKICRTLTSSSSQRFFLGKTIKFFCKIVFAFCQTCDFCIFLKSVQNSASFDTLYAQFRRTLIRGDAIFLEDKRSNKIETDQYFKKHFFIN
jgi:hypothetical protein